MTAPVTQRPPTRVRFRERRWHAIRRLAEMHIARADDREAAARAVIHAAHHAVAATLGPGAWARLNKRTR